MHANKLLWIYVKLTHSNYCEFLFKVIGHVFEMPQLSGVIEEGINIAKQPFIGLVAWTYDDIVCITNGKANVANWVHNLLLDNYLLPSSQWSFFWFNDQWVLSTTPPKRVLCQRKCMEEWVYGTTFYLWDGPLDHLKGLIIFLFVLSKHSIQATLCVWNEKVFTLHKMETISLLPSWWRFPILTINLINPTNEEWPNLGRFQLCFSHS